jgi:hypothetical protein
VVPGGRFSGLSKCGTSWGGAAGVPAAACTVPSGVGPGGGAGAGIAGSAGAATGAGGGASHGKSGGAGGGGGAISGAGAGAGAGGTGSAEAVGAPRVIAATTPSAPDITVSTFASHLNLTDGPLSLPIVPVLLVLQSDSQNCYIWASCDKSVN